MLGITLRSSIIRRATLNCVKPVSKLRYSTKPPSFFSEYLEGSKDQTHPHSSPSSTPHASQSQQHGHQQPSQVTVQQAASKYSTMRDLTFIVAIMTLSYLAVDNYRSKVELEQKHKELSLKHIRAVATQQNNFNNYRKKRELQTVNERKNIQKREMKMAFHISMLRKQLIDAGVKPVEIEQAIKEFEKNVKMETSISNVSGTALWVVDESPMKAYVPSVHDYETKK